MKSYTRQQHEQELRVFRFKNEPKPQPRVERIEERKVRMSEIFNDIMARALKAAIDR